MKIKWDNLPEDALIFPYRVYFSAAVRGKNGDKATEEEKSKNIERGKVLAYSLQAKFPNWIIYVPHEHEIFIELGWKMGLLTSKNIMKIFCEMVSERDILVAVEEDVAISGGVRLEIKAAKKAKKLVLGYSNVMGL